METPVTDDAKKENEKNNGETAKKTKKKCIKSAACQNGHTILT